MRGSCLAAVEEMDLSASMRAYHVDGHGRAAHEPGMMVALLLYAYCGGQRSARVIERECVEDVAYRVIAANQPARSHDDREVPSAPRDGDGRLFSEVLELCAEAGLVEVGVIAVDGTKVHANASQHATRDYEQIAKEILEEAAEIDRPRTSCMARSAVMSCRRSCRPSRAGGAGCARPSAAWTRSAPQRPSRSRVRALAPCPVKAPAGGGSLCRVRGERRL